MTTRPKRLELRLDRLQQLDGDGARELVFSSDRAGNLGGDRPKETIAEKIALP
jgi:hypothetical protein